MPALVQFLPPKQKQNAQQVLLAGVATRCAMGLRVMGCIMVAVAVRKHASAMWRLCLRRYDCDATLRDLEPTLAKLQAMRESNCRSLG